MRMLRSLIAASALTPERLRELLDYDPATGVFTRRPTGRPVGYLAGPKHHRAVDIKIGGKTYKAHRLAWLWMTGAWPQNQIDHENLNPIDNRWDNLREATGSQNCMNRRVRAGKMRGVAKGVFYRKDKPEKDIRRWRVIIMVAGRRINLGHYETHDEAVQIYATAARELHQEFARLS